MTYGWSGHGLTGVVLVSCLLPGRRTPGGGARPAGTFRTGDTLAAAMADAVADSNGAVATQGAAGTHPPHRCPHDVKTTLACIRADVEANNSAISKAVLVVYRFGHLLYGGHLWKPVSDVLWPVYRVAELVWSKLLAGSELAAGMCAGPGIYLPHGGRGVVVTEGVVIGRDVCLFHGTGIGWEETRKGMPQPPVPVIGDRARIGTGSRVMGGVEVGADALVGANAVVFKNVPAGSTVMGNPARIVAAPSPSGDRARETP